MSSSLFCYVENCYSIFTVTPEQLQMDFQDS